MKPKNEYFLNLFVFPYDPLLDANNKNQVCDSLDKLMKSILNVKKYAELLSERKWSLSFSIAEDEIYLSAYPPVSFYSRVEIEDELSKIGIKLTNDNGYIDYSEIEEEEEVHSDFSDPFDI